MNFHCLTADISNVDVYRCCVVQLLLTRAEHPHRVTPTVSYNCLFTQAEPPRFEEPTRRGVKLLMVGRAHVRHDISVITLAAHHIHASQSTFSTDAHGENHAVLLIFPADAYVHDRRPVSLLPVRARAPQPALHGHGKKLQLS